jgi:signal transduction histidine kinase
MILDLFRKPDLKGLVCLCVFIFITFSCGNEKKDLNIEGHAQSERRFHELYETRQYDKALAEINKLIAYQTGENNDSLLLVLIINKAELQRKLTDLETALKTLESHNDKVNKMRVGQHTAYYFNRKAAILLELNQIVDALQAVKRAQKIDSIIDDKSWRFSSNLNIEGSIYRDLGQYRKSQKALRKAVNFSFQENNTIEYIQSLYNLILSFDKSENYDSIPGYANKILSSGIVKQELAIRGKTLNILAKTYFNLGQSDTAYIYADSAYQVAIERTKEIVDDRVNMYRASDALIKEKLENDLLEAQNKRQYLWIYLILTIAVSIGVITILVYRQRSRYKSLSESKQSINTQLEESLAFNNKLIGVVAHDIRSPLANIISVLELYRTGVLDKKSVDQMILQLESASKNASQLLENLLRWVKSQDSEFVPQYSKINLSELIGEVVGETQIQMDNKNIRLETELEDIRLRSDPDFLALIIRNLLTNAIKFSNSGGKIVITTIEDSENCRIQIKDEGVGMSAEKINRLSSGKSFSEWGTNAEKGTGLGVKLVNELIESMEGQLSFISQEGKGTKAIVTLPIDITKS